MNDFLKLTTKMKGLLERFGYMYTDEAIDKIVDVWAENKNDLIEHLRKHPNWNEDELAIVFPHEEYERKIDRDGINRFTDWFSTRFCYDVSAEKNSNELYSFLFRGNFLYEPSVTVEEKKTLDMLLPDLHAHAGAKKSRLVNKIASYLEISTHPDYNRRFAAYSDCLNILKYNRTTVISVNPLDYWTMSFGNSWSSCHTIDKNNIREMPNGYHGQYSSGTTSYMLDGVTMILYTIDDDYEGNDFWNQPKINRQVFHYCEGKLVQGRLYPQDNDGNDEGYTPFRNIVQKVIADCYDISNLWTLKKGCEYAGKYIYSEGTHYRDYDNYNNCNLSLSQDGYSEDCFEVGHDPICIYCGCEHEVSENISCCGCIKCAECGCVVYEDDVHWIDGNPYCDDCCFYCDCCDEYCIGESYEVNGETVCQACYEEEYTECDCCGEIYRNNRVEYSERFGHICRNCADNNYARCSCCNELFEQDEILNIGYDYVCEDCRDRNYRQCSVCKMYFKTRYIYIDAHGNERCVWCPEDITFEQEDN